MAHIHTVIDDDPHFKIDVLTREISCTVEEKTVLIQGDHNSERFTFDIPKEIDGHDLTQCNLIRIHFINVSADDKNTTSPGIYEVTDLEESTDDPNTLVFSWLIEKEATTYVGTLNFIVEFICKTDNIIDYAWHTAICSDAAIIATGLDNSEIIIGEYYDTLDTWIARIEASGTAVVNAAIEDINEVRTDALNRINEVVNDTTKDFEESINARADEVKEEISIHAVDVSGIIVQEKGANTDKVISQKAVTDELNGLDTKVSTSLATMRSDELAYRTELRKETLELLSLVNHAKLSPAEDSAYAINATVPYVIVSNPGITERKYRIELYITVRNTYTNMDALIECADILNETCIKYDGDDPISITSDSIIFTDHDVIKIRNCSLEAYKTSAYGQMVIETSVQYELNGELYEAIIQCDDETITNIGDWETGIYTHNYDIDTMNIDYYIMDEYKSISVYTPSYEDQRPINVDVNAVGIDSIVETSSEGHEHTYTILLTDGREIPFSVKDGVGISSVDVVDHGDYADTYRINLTDGNSTIFTVPNANSVGIITSDSGPAIHATDLIPLEHTIKTKVRSKNLIPYPYATEPGIKAGIDFSIDETDYGIIMKGIAETNTSYDFVSRVRKNMRIEKGKTYTFSCTSDKLTTANGYVYFQIYVDGGTSPSHTVSVSGGNSTTFTSKWTGYANMGVVVKAGVECENDKVLIQVEESDKITSYTPYVDVSTVKLTRCGKNLLPPPILEAGKTKYGVTLTDNGDGSITINGTATADTAFILYQGDMMLKGTYTLSGFSGGSGTTGYIQPHIDGVGKPGLIDGSKTYENVEGVLTKIQFSIIAGASFDNVKIHLMLEVGDTATEYEPYKGINYPILSDGTPLDYIRSLSPITNLISNKRGVIIDATYNLDLTTAFNSLVKGTAGEDGVGIESVVQTKTAVGDGGINEITVTLTDGTVSTFDVRNGSKGDPYILTEDDKTEIAENVKSVCIAKNQGAANVGKILVVGTDGNLTLADMPEGGASGDVIGTLDDSNNILLSGSLADGTYTLKYENEDGTYAEIGSLTVGEATPSYTNLATPDDTASGQTVWESGGWCNDSYMAGSSYAYRAATDGKITTNTIAVAHGDRIYVKGITYNTGTFPQIALFNADGAYIKHGYVSVMREQSYIYDLTATDGEDYWYFDNEGSGANDLGTRFIRIAGVPSGSIHDIIITKNEPIV